MHLEDARVQNPVQVSSYYIYTVLFSHQSLIAAVTQSVQTASPAAAANLIDTWTSVITHQSDRSQETGTNPSE